MAEQEKKCVFVSTWTLNILLVGSNLFDVSKEVQGGRGGGTSH